MSISDVTLLEMPPPDMPAALLLPLGRCSHLGRAVHGPVRDGRLRPRPVHDQGRLAGVHLVRPGRPRADHQDRRAEVQRLVDGIARSGKWLDHSMAHRMQAADFSGHEYYHQDPKLLRFVLSKPPDRVKYTNLTVVRKDFEEIEALGREAGILNGTAHFDDYADPSFVPDEMVVRPYDWEGPP